MSGEPKAQNFSELNFQFGQPLSLLLDTVDNSVEFECNLIGCIGRECLIIGPGASGMLPRMEEGQPLMVKARLATGIALFQTVVLYLSEVPTIMLYLDYPSCVSFKQVREALRVKVTWPVLVTASGTPVPGRIVDISTGGARLQMTEPVGEVGDPISLKCKFSVLHIERRLTVNAVIRSIAAEGADSVYGVCFESLPEQDASLLYGAIFQALSCRPLQTL